MHHTVPIANVKIFLKPGANPNTNTVNFNRFFMVLSSKY